MTMTEDTTTIRNYLGILKFMDISILKTNYSSRRSSNNLTSSRQTLDDVFFVSHPTLKSLTRFIIFPIINISNSSAKNYCNLGLAPQ